MTSVPDVRTIPAGVPFAEALARGILALFLSVPMAGLEKRLGRLFEPYLWEQK